MGDGLWFIHSCQVINTDGGFLSSVHTQLVADLALTYKIELRSQLTAQPNVLSAASPGRSAYRGAGSMLCAMQNARAALIPGGSKLWRRDSQYA